MKKIYAYTTEDAKNTEWIGCRKGIGLIKIGETVNDVHKRIQDQFQASAYNGKDNYELLLVEENPIGKDGLIFNDHKVHKYLTDMGIQRILRTEWFECTIDEVKKAIEYIKTGVIPERINDNKPLVPSKLSPKLKTKERKLIRIRNIYDIILENNGKCVLNNKTIAKLLMEKYAFKTISESTISCKICELTKYMQDINMIKNIGSYTNPNFQIVQDINSIVYQDIDIFECNKFTDEDILNVIRQFDYSPSLPEITRSLGANKSTLQNRIQGLVDNNVINKVYTQSIYKFNGKLTRYYISGDIPKIPSQEIASTGVNRLKELIPATPDEISNVAIILDIMSKRKYWGAGVDFDALVGRLEMKRQLVRSIIIQHLSEYYILDELIDYPEYRMQVFRTDKITKEELEQKHQQYLDKHRTIDVQAQRILDWLEDKPQGVTYEQIADYMGWNTRGPVIRVLKVIDDQVYKWFERTEGCSPNTRGFAHVSLLKYRPKHSDVTPFMNQYFPRNKQLHYTQDYITDQTIKEALEEIQPANGMEITRYLMQRHNLHKHEETYRQKVIEVCKAMIKAGILTDTRIVRTQKSMFAIIDNKTYFAKQTIADTVADLLERILLLEENKYGLSFAHLVELTGLSYKGIKDAVVDNQDKFRVVGVMTSSSTIIHRVQLQQRDMLFMEGEVGMQVSTSSLSVTLPKTLA